MRTLFFTLLSLFGFTLLNAQRNSGGYWQQHVDYTMEVDMNVENYQYTGTQTLAYTNNSPDTLHQVFYHLYFNAFRPGSQMDVRSRTIADPDDRVMDRISKLGPKEIGYLHVKILTRDGNKIKYDEVGTVLEVWLDEPILPGETTTFKMKFEGQVPVQIRRSGRNNKEGVALSMTQWYPKMAEYDYEGWHADPYIAREFHGVWGDFDVKITIDSDYIIGGTGYLVNGNEIGYNYQDEGVKVSHEDDKTLTWHFIAPRVHDFAWAADPEYIHDKLVAEDGTVLHFLYQNHPEIIENWKKLQPIAEEFLLYYNKHIGPYPWKQYTIIQGGDGGMEYAMATLITGGRELGSLVGVTAHEFAHAWFQHLLATIESKHAWMDEGFTTYISTLAQNKIMAQGKERPLKRAYKGYVFLAKSGKEQPQTTHSDRFKYNFAYGIAAYSKGAIFLSQLRYVIGEENVAKSLKRYYELWKFKHPTPNDFIRVAEQVSGAELDWYLTDWTRTTNTIDYAIKSVEGKGNSTTVTLERIDLMPMPIEIMVTYTDGDKELIYIPLQMMRWKKEDHTGPDVKRILKEDWAWAYPTYEFTLDHAKNEISKMEIDPSDWMADVNRKNNVWSAEQSPDEE